MHNNIKKTGRKNRPLSRYNSTGRRVDGRGNVIQERQYGPDGRPVRDIDHGHPDHHGLAPGQAHEHTWIRLPDGSLRRVYTGPIPR